MKAVVMTGIRRFELSDVPKPAIKKGDDVLLKVQKVGVCGSDVHYYRTGRIGSQVVEFPFILGHECSATVEAVGGKVDRVRVGDKVAVDPAASCHNCDQCRMGRENTCRKLRFLGTPGQGNGCLSEYIVMPQESCFAANGIGLDRAALCEPFTIGVYSVKRAVLPQGAKIAILGAGPIGLSCLAAAKAQGAAAVYMTDKIDHRVGVARKAGADWAGNPDKTDIAAEILKSEPLGLDCVFECAGEQETLDQAVDLLRPGGTLVMVGIPEFERVSFVIDKTRRKELTIVNIRRQNGCTQSAVDLLASGRVNIDYMINHRFKPDGAAEAFEMAGDYRDGIIKAIIEF